MIENLLLKEPLYLLGLIAIPLAIFLRSRKKVDAVYAPFAFEWYRPTAVSNPKGRVLVAYIAYALLVVAIARPQKVDVELHQNQLGYDIVLVLDLSQSMSEEDYTSGYRRINRLAAVEPVLNSFVTQRPTDRIAVVAFADKALTLAPLTFDHSWLKTQTDRILKQVQGEWKLIEKAQRREITEEQLYANAPFISSVGMGTAFGDATGIAITRLDQGKKQRGKKRQGAFIILLTDGEDTSSVDFENPLDAASIANEHGYPIYSIGVGSQSRSRKSFNPKILKEMASMTNGHFFMAKDSNTIEDAFEKISESEKIEFDSQTVMLVEELFMYPAYASLFLLLGTASMTLGKNRREAYA